MSNSPQNNNAELGGGDSKVQFKTSDIGRWASQQESPFAKQNRERQAKKQENSKKRQKAAPYIIIASSVLAISLAVWGLVVLIISLVNRPVEFNPETYTPEIAGSSMEDVNEYRELLQNFYNGQQDAINGNSGGDAGSGESSGNSGGLAISEADQNKLYEDVDKVVQNTLDTPAGQENTSAIKLAQMGFCMENGCYQQGIDASQQVDIDSLSAEQLALYYNILANCYYGIGDKDKAAEYFNMPAYELGGDENAEDE